MAKRVAAGRTGGDGKAGGSRRSWWGWRSGWRVVVLVGMAEPSELVTETSQKCHTFRFLDRKLPG